MSRSIRSQDRSYGSRASISVGVAFMMSLIGADPMTAKIALVTGANGGLGKHVTKALLDGGFAVVGLAPKIQETDFDHPHFTALPATLDSLTAARQAADT